MNQITVLGSINMDLSICSDTFPQIGETIHGFDFTTQPGGKGANQAIAIGNLGGQVSFLGCVGDDHNGTILLDTLQTANVDTTHLEFCPNVTSGTAMIFVCNGDNSIIINRGANGCVSEDYVLRHAPAIAGSKVLLSQLEIPLPTVIAAFRLAKDRGVTTILNPAPIAPLPEELLSLTDILILNETEAEFLTGQTIPDINAAKEHIQLLLQMGIPKAIITLGGLGCVYTDDRGNIHHRPARKVEAIDTTGAGDTFCGAFSYAQAAGYDIHEAVKLATLCSSVTVTKRGAALSIPTKAEINQIIQKEGFLHELP